MSKSLDLQILENLNLVNRLNKIFIKNFIF